MSWFKRIYIALQNAVSRFLNFTPVRWARERFFFTAAQWDYISTALLISALSGLVMRAAYAPYEWSLVAWVGMAPFLYQLFGRSMKEGFWLGYVFGITFFYSNLFWLNTLHVFNPFAPLGIVALALLCSIFTGVFGAFSALAMSNTAYARLLFVPLWWAVIETARAVGELGFPWIYLAHTQVQFDFMLQMVDLTGTAGLSALIVLVNLVVADIFRRRIMRHESTSRAWVGWALAVACVVLAGSYGFIRLDEARQGDAGQPDYVVGVIQPGISQLEKLASVAHSREDLREHFQGKARRLFEDNLKGLARLRREQGLGPADLYVLPESALVNESFSVDPIQQEEVHGWAREIGAPILFGANRIGEDDMFYNSAFLATPEGGVELANAYDKMHLVPFGEYASYFDIIPGFTSSILGIAEFTPGEGPRAQEAGGVRIGTLICFESCFPYLFRRYEKAGVDLYAVLTNDAWYGMSSGPRRHQVQSLFRAVETRRPIIRVANTGISCMIDPFGRTSYRSMALREGMSNRAFWHVPFRPASLGEGMSFYMRYGEWLSLLGLVYCLSVVFFIGWRFRRSVDEMK